ncbi:acetyl-CoA carboxylase biotin carboxylase subunit family protein [Micromonospora maritima]|uniref:Acetyl-CoA carboxylase biotin carboxylase subunit family protein n=1 Tax=Micromonospora maritima TaxID=986711 RepID=A0ABW7ZDH5_9ACTN
MLVEQTGIVADALGLPGPGIRAARVCRNKYLQRFYLSQWGPRLVVVPPQGRAGLDVSSMPFPAVLKPSGRRSSSGVRAVHDPGSLPVLLTEYPAAETLLVEEYVVGAEYSVEAVVQHGRIVFESATQKRTTEDGSDWFVELAHTVPAPPGAEHEALLAANRDIVDRLGVVAGIVHTELRLGRDGRPVLMEVAARTPVDGIMPLYHLATGRALEQTIMEVALDEPATHPRPRRYARQVYLPQPSGTLQDVKLRWPGVEPQWIPEGQPWPSSHPANPTTRRPCGTSSCSRNAAHASANCASRVTGV